MYAVLTVRELHQRVLYGRGACLEVRVTNRIGILAAAEPERQLRTLMKLVGRVFIGVIALAGITLVWGLLEPYVIDQTSPEVALPGLPTAWEAQQVAVLADLQVGMWLDNTATVRRMVSRLVDKPPALVLIAGDFIYHPGKNGSAKIAEAVALLKPLSEANIPTYAVLGNHDYAMPTEKAKEDEAVAGALREALEAAGIQVLQNEAVALTDPDGKEGADPLYLVGVGSHVADEDRVQVALKGLPQNAPRLAFMHHPESFKAFPKNAAPFAVAGHTHGGQFRIPFTPSRTWMTFAREDEVHADGWIKGYGASGNTLYINRGIGFSVLPLRLNCPPELTLLRLTRG